MLYDITTKEKAINSLCEITGLAETQLQDTWLSALDDIDTFWKSIYRQITNWDITSTEFVVKHVSASCCELRDVQKHGLLYLPDVLKRDTFLSRLFKKCDFIIDVDSAKLQTSGYVYELNYEELRHQPWTEIYHDELVQISRCLYQDYLSTFLHCSNPYEYGIGLAKHPEFMEYIKKLGAKGKYIVDRWDRLSKGYTITAKVPFHDVYYETFQISQESFARDVESGYLQCKKHLVIAACELTFEDYDHDSYLFLKHNTRIKPENFISIEEKS